MSERLHNKLDQAITMVACAIREHTEQSKIELEWRRSHFQVATKQDLCEMEHRIMSVISDFAAKQNAFNDRLDATVTGLQGDIKALNDKIEQLQNSPGAITPEDQALLNDLEARGDAIAAKLEALDALTPPVPPVA